MPQSHLGCSSVSVKDEELALLMQVVKDILNGTMFQQ